MTEAEEIAREHVRWCVNVDRRTLEQVILEVGGTLPKGGGRMTRFEDAVKAVAIAWLWLTADEIQEAA